MHTSWLILFSLPLTHAFVKSLYYSAYSIYETEPLQIQAQNLTHVIYGFGALNTTTGEMYSSDLYGDTQKELSVMAYDLPYKGGLNQLVCSSHSNQHFEPEQD